MKRADAPTASAPRQHGSRFLTLVLHLIGLVAVARALHIAQTHQDPLALILGLKFYALRFGLLGAAALLIFGALQELGTLRDGRSSARRAESAAAALRWAFVTSILGWLLFLWIAQPFQRIWFDLALGLVPGAWALLLRLQRAGSRRQARWMRAVDITAFSLCAAALGLEVGLRTWASFWPVPLTARVGAGPGELIERFRCQPGLVRFGFACNSRGYYDTEFYRKEPKDERQLIVAIGDSFNVGTVPHAWHFTSVLEELTGARVYNMGVAGIGPAEYLSLLVTEALPLNPDQILIGVFIGNDLDVIDVFAGLPDASLRTWFQRDQVLLAVLPQRLARVRNERLRAGAASAGSSAAEKPGDGKLSGDREQIAAAFPWVVDPALEEPTYSPETFHALETLRARSTCSEALPSFDLFCESMLAARRAAGSIPLCVMLIPDEFQVEDALWEIVRARAGRELDRDRPQRQLTSWLAEEGIPCLDLLPILRAVPLAANGQRHLYHALDTHFNARGNRVAAEALAEFLTVE